MKKYENDATEMLTSGSAFHIAQYSLLHIVRYYLNMYT
jgi:hypothetical protein